MIAEYLFIAVVFVGLSYHLSKIALEHYRAARKARREALLG